MASVATVAFLSLLCMLFPALASCIITIADGSCHAHRTDISNAVVEASMMARRAIERLDRKDMDDIDANHLYWVLFGNSNYEDVRHVYAYMATLEHSEEEIRVSCRGDADACGRDRKTFAYLQSPFYTARPDISYSRMALCDNFLLRLPADRRRPALEILQTGKLLHTYLSFNRPLSALLIHEWAHTYETMLPARPVQILDVLIQSRVPSTAKMARGIRWTPGATEEAYGFTNCVRLAADKDRADIKLNAETYMLVALALFLDQWTWTSGHVSLEDGRPLWTHRGEWITPHPEVYFRHQWPALPPPWSRPARRLSEPGKVSLPPASLLPE
ncbi:MAG: hypothetical protein M1826_006424 [Phylliscum demangeonii]|nr:MAG: hypothetical protein M1826_006424 [Phylliscum demangeonii]